jgi:hypothetical protein
MNLNRLLLEKGQNTKGAIQSHFLHNNAPLHMAKPVHGMLEMLSWEVLLHRLTPPD